LGRYAEVFGKRGDELKTKKTEVFDIVNDVFYFNTLHEKQPEFLLEPYLVKGAVNFIQANPGVGKTFLICELAAKVSTGGEIFGQRIKQGKVLLQNAEDDYETTLLKRVNECRCDRNQIFGIKIKNKPLTFDDSRIEQIFRDERPLLAIFDPVQAFLSSDMDMKQANQVRQTMARLSVLASEYGVCVVLVAHLNKQSMVTNGILRMLGSVDFAAVARSILTLGQLPEKYSYPESHRGIYHTKCNLAKCGEPLVYEISSNGGIEWIGADTRIEESDLLSSNSGFRKSKGRPAEATVKAEALLKRILADGKALVSIIRSESEREGISNSTLYETKKKLGIISEEIDKTVYWSIPKNDPNKTFSE
jgi:hypothetical protein